MESRNNFRAIIDYRAEKDDLLSNHLATAPKHAKYLSTEIQNEFISLCGKQISNSITEKCRSSQYFTVMADESAHFSNKEQFYRKVWCWRAHSDWRIFVICVDNQHNWRSTPCTTEDRNQKAWPQSRLHRGSGLQWYGEYGRKNRGCSGQGHARLPRCKICWPPHNPYACFYFCVMIKGMRRAWLFVVSECPSRGCWKQFLISRPYEHSQCWGGGEERIYPGVKCPPPFNPNACFHFYVMIKEMKRAWLFVVSECPSRGCWKQFLISCLYEHSQWGGGIYSGVKCPPPPQGSCMLSFLCNDQRDWESLVIWSFWMLSKRMLETISHILSLWT